MSLIYNENKKGPRTVPSVRSNEIGAQSDFTPFTATCCSLKHRKESIYLNVVSPIPQLNSLRLRSSWGGLLQAISKLNMNVSTCPFFVQNFSPIICDHSQLSFTTMFYLYHGNVCPSRWAMIFEHVCMFKQLTRYASQGNWAIIEHKYPVFFLKSGQKFARDYSFGISAVYIDC